MKEQNVGRVARAKARKRRNRIIITVEVILLFILCGVLWFVTEFTDEESGVKRVNISEGDILINEGVNQEGAHANGESHDNNKLSSYRTIALFGLDSRTEEITKDTRSDTIIVASINNDTKEVKMMSVYRDTYLNLGNDTYNKCNTAYAKGGALQAINMLNINLDLNITDFVAVGFKGVMDVVNSLGGIMIDVDEVEMEHLNDFQLCMSEDMKIDYKKVTKPGYQLLNGLQTVAYCRIRQTKGDDFKRTERQREVLQAIFDKTKDMDVTKLVKLVNNVFSDFYTSVDLEEIVTLLSGLGSYTLTNEGGFPSTEYRANVLISGNVGASVICTNLEEAVKDFHGRFFDEEDYEVSEALKVISRQIDANTAPYFKN